MKLTYSEFKEVIGEDLPFQSIKRYLLDVVKVYNNPRFKNQRGIINITGDNYIDYGLIETYESFGITTSLFCSKSRYLFIVEEGESLREQINDLDAIMPEGQEPTDIVVLSDNKEFISSVYYQCLERYPSIQLGNSLGSEDTTLVQDLSKGILSKFSLYDITAELKEFNKNPSNDAKVLDEFCYMVENISKKAVGKIVVFSGDIDLQYLYSCVVTELYMRYNTKFYVYPAYRDQLISNIRECLYSNITSTVFEKIDYLRNLPMVMIELLDTSNAFHIIKSRAVNISIDYVELDTSSLTEIVGKSGTFSIDDIEFLPINSIYDINDLDDKYNELTKKIHSLYDYLDIGSNSIIDMSNLAIFRREGIMYIGRVSEINGAFKSITMHPLLGTIERTLPIELAIRLVPVDIFLDGIATSKVILKNMNIPFSTNLVVPKKTNRPGCSYLKTARLLLSSDWDLKYVDNITIGMYSINCTKMRVGFYEFFTKIIGIKSTRINLDCFGGFHPKVKRFIKLT